MSNGCAPERICAVVVTYNPDNGLPGRVERIARQVGRVVVVDNGSRQSPAELLAGVSARFPIELVLNGANLGIAAALNRGVSRARDAGFGLVLLFDHDTVALESMVTTLCRVLREHHDAGRVAVVGSNYVETANGLRLVDASEAGSSWVDRRVAITSGSLIPLAAYDALGGFREELFIDEVDTDYCLRARARGYHVIVSTEVTMEHTIGAAHVERRFLWRTARPVNYSPARWYYIARNTVVMAREHGRHEPRWISLNVFGHLKWLAKAIIYEPQRAEKVRRVLRGVWDGARGRLGPAG